MTDDDNKQLVILALGIAGIVIGFFAYLIYIKSRDTQNISQSLHQGYDERVYTMLLNQQSQIDYLSSRDKLISLNQHDINKLEVPKQQELDASNILNQKSNDYSKKIAQMYGMQ